mgnify:CR=1 FL=1
MSSIKISQLSPLVGALSSSDFFPIDQSSSLTTYRATLSQLQLFTSTGSFTGSLTGSLLGTASWANNATSASYATASTSASYALSSSYANVAVSLLNNTNVGGSGTVNYVPLWTAGTTLGNSALYYTANRTLYSNLYVLDGKNFVTYAGSGKQSYIICSAGGTNANIVLESSYSSSDSWVLSMGAGISPSDSTRGMLDLVMYSGSNQLISKQSNDPDGYGTIRVLRTRSNGLFWWPLGGSQTVSRDGTFNIGVDSNIENTSSRVLIDVYSGSSVSNPQTYHLQKAIEVRYGSSSLTTTFCVSSSGKTYIGNSLTVVGNTTFNSPNYLNIVNPGDIVSIDAEKTASQFIQLMENGTASVTMSTGQTVRLFVNQSSNRNLYITGSIFSGSNYYGCPIVWQGGSDPTITPIAGHVDMITMHAINTSTLGPKGGSAIYNTVIYATTSSNFY